MNWIDINEKLPLEFVHCKGVDLTTINKKEEIVFRHAFTWREPHNYNHLTNVTHWKPL